MPFSFSPCRRGSLRGSDPACRGPASSLSENVLDPADRQETAPMPHFRAPRARVRSRTRPLCLSLDPATFSDQNARRSLAFYRAEAFGNGVRALLRFAGRRILPRDCEMLHLRPLLAICSGISGTPFALAGTRFTMSTGSLRGSHAVLLRFRNRIPPPDTPPTSLQESYAVEGYATLRASPESFDLSSLQQRLADSLRGSAGMSSRGLDVPRLCCFIRPASRSIRSFP